MATTTPAPPGQRASYGIDAPNLVKGFFIGGTIALLVAVGATFLPWPRVAVAVAASLAGLAAAYALGMGCYMLFGSLVGKVRGRERLLDLVPWRGDERVLDVGCGRGLMLVAAARRAPTGRAVGIDLWQAEDQSGNRPETTLANAQIEGVSDRVEVKTGDARQLPFDDELFDVVVSHWVIHNLYDPADRVRALGEMARVLRPCGWVLLADIEHHAEYVERLGGLGFTGVRHVVSRASDAARRAITFGSFRPGTVVGQKPA